MKTAQTSGRACFAVVILVTAAACGGGSTKAAAPHAAPGSTVSPTAAPAIARSSSMSESPSIAAISPGATGAPVALTDARTADATPADNVSTGGTACTLITGKDVQGLLGKDPGTGSPFTSQGSSQCQYGDFHTVMVVVNINHGNGRLLFDHARSNPQIVHQSQLSDVAGVGDKAFGIYIRGTASIYFVKGDALVLVMVENNKATSPPKDQAVALARTAAGRI